jgi:pyruvate dehydrogenase E2 component (dihydrolipoamide acetyltransferase)
MAIEFKLPEVSEGVTSVDVAEVRVREGDVIESGAIVCEVETDKAVAEITCPHAGRIAKVLMKPGETIRIGQPLLLIETANPSESTAPVPTPAPPAAASASDSRSRSAAPPAPGPPQTVPPQSSGPDASDSGADRRVEFRLPEVSEGVASVDVASVNVKEGDKISGNTVVCEVETDKAVAEITCPHEGTVVAVHVKPGDTISIGALLITLTSTSDATATTARTSAPSASPPTPRAPQPAGTSAATTARTAPTVAAGKNDGPPAAAGPATRRLARKLGVNLKLVKGTAAGGRITIEDLEAYVRERMAQQALPSPASGPGFGIVAAAPLPDFSRFGPIEKVSMNKIFRTAAANLHAAWLTIPHVTQHELADITELENARKRYVRDNPNSPKITMTAIMIKAVVGALKAFPDFNSSVDMASGELIRKHYYHIGVAVDTPNGLVVPVIRNCDQKNVLQVAAELTDLATRARDRKLKTEEMQGGTFTITNLGGIGGTAFTPIVNYPEVAILGLSRGLNQLAMKGGMVIDRLMLPLSLSYDHRAVNGADAARFVVKLSGSLTNFFELF